MGVVQWQENRPSRWTCAQEELSVPKASKEGSVGSLGLWGEGGGLWAGPQKALSFPTSQRWGCALVLCVPIGGLLSVSPQRRDLGQLHLPHGTPVPLRWSNCRSWVPLCHAALEVPPFPGCFGGLRCLQGPQVSPQIRDLGMTSCSPTPVSSHWGSPLPCGHSLGWRIRILSHVTSPREGEGLKLLAQALQGDQKIPLSRDGSGCDNLGMSRGSASSQITGPCPHS